MNRSRRSRRSAVPKSFLRSPAAARVAFGFVTAMLLLAVTTLGRGSTGSVEKRLERPTPAASASRTPEPPANPLLATPPDAALPDTRLGTRQGDRFASGPPKSTADVTSPAELLTSLLIVLAILGVVLYATVKLLRRARLAPSRVKALELVDALSLGPRRFVHVVRFRDRTLILGSSNDEVQLLVEYADSEWEERAPTVPEAEEEPAPPPAAEVMVTPPASRPPAPARETGPAPRPATAEPRKAAGRNAAPTVRPVVMPVVRGRSGPSRLVDVEVGGDPEGGIGLPGAHRVPPAFRHLLRNAVEKEGSAT